MLALTCVLQSTTDFDVLILTVLIKYNNSHSTQMVLSYETDLPVKILKFGTPQTTAIIVLKIEKFDVTLH